MRIFKSHPLKLVSMWLNFIVKFFGVTTTLKKLVKHNSYKIYPLTLPNLKNNSNIILIAFALSILPIFFINLMVLLLSTDISILHITNLMWLYTLLLSLSSFYIFFILIWNYMHNNKNNIWLLIDNIFEFYNKNRILFNKHKIFFYFIIIFMILLLSIFVLLNSLLVNLITSKILIVKYKILAYIWFRLNSLPYFIYFYMMVVNIIIYLTGNSKYINISLFSPNMVTSITLPKLILVVSLISIAPCFLKILSYFNLLFIGTVSNIYTIPIINNIETLEFLDNLIKVDSPLLTKGLILHDNVFTKKPVSNISNFSVIISSMRSVYSSIIKSLSNTLALFYDTTQVELSYKKSIQVKKISNIIFYKQIYNKPLSFNLKKSIVLLHLSEYKELKVQITKTYEELCIRCQKYSDVIQAYEFNNSINDIDLLTLQGKGRIYTLPRFFFDCKSPKPLNDIIDMLRKSKMDNDRLRLECLDLAKLNRSLLDNMWDQMLSVRNPYLWSLSINNPFYLSRDKVSNLDLFPWLMSKYPHMNNFGYTPNGINLTNNRVRVYIDNEVSYKV